MDRGVTRFLERANFNLSAAWAHPRRFASSEHKKVVEVV